MSKKEKLKIIPLGGLGEVGKNMTAYEYGGAILIVDAGSLFPENDMLGIDYIIPDFDSLLDAAAIGDSPIYAYLFADGDKQGAADVRAICTDARVNDPLGAPRFIEVTPNGATDVPARFAVAWRRVALE